jgi:O-6-methylguanine DNA methyltransferase
MARQIAAFLEGERDRIDAACDLERFSAFQRRVLETTRRIPRGAVASYAEVARRAGYPGAHRAVGNTMRINPAPLIIPCHRVVGSHGIGGYGRLGVGLKRRLLALEGAPIAGA